MKVFGTILGGGGSRTREEARALIRRADQSRDSKNWANAARLYQQALALTPERAEIWVQYGHALKESGQRAEAEGAYRQSLSLEPLKADTHLQLGHVLKLLGRPDQAGQAYLDALRLNPGLYDALREINDLIRRGVVISQDDLAAAFGGAGEPDEVGPPELQRDLALARSSMETLLEGQTLGEADSAPLMEALIRLKSIEGQLGRGVDEGDPAAPIVFDVADLLSYFANARLPTGIQRVQIEVISSLLRQQGSAGATRVCCFSEAVDTWVEVPGGFFLKLCALSLSGGDVRDPAWLAMLAQLGRHMITAKTVVFPPGAFLVNLGTSWWLQNYFLQVRRAKAKSGIHYVPFVHDFIPIMTPEHCIRDLTLDFITWALGVFEHAEFFLVNSEATKRDLMTVACTLGHEVDETRVKVIRLDADFRKAETAPPERTHRAFGLRPSGYVLFVSTIESRKNHLGAFNAWLNLARKHGARAIPKLVCVGNEGWLNDAVHAKLRSSEVLRERVVMLSKLADAELADLYENCLFTLYPSHYEGWGLPVTESLCHGKTPLISDASSLPEAGGDFAAYFQAGSDVALTEALERMIFDGAYRNAKEQAIADGFAPRPWREIASEINGAIAGWAVDAGRVAVDPTPQAMPARLGVYYPVRRNQSLRIWPGMVAGEMYRAGSGWWAPENWGVWTRPRGGEIAIRIARGHGPLRAFFRVKAPQDVSTAWSLEFSAPDMVGSVVGLLDADKCRWASVDLPASAKGLAIHALLKGAQMQDFALTTDGDDRRIVSIGLEGFFICERDDQAARLDFAEAAATDDLERLTLGYLAHRP